MRSPSFARRLADVLAGLALFGIGISLIIEAELGAAPWDVFHTGLSERTGMSIGTVIIAVGAVLLLLWIPLRQRPGLATVLNAVEIGAVADIALSLLPSPERIVVRVLFLAGGLLLVAVGSGLYIGAGLGSGPRDGIMMGLARRGMSVRVARTALEVLVVGLGVLLGGSAGIGTIVFAVGIGPLVQVFLPPRERRSEVAATA